MHVSESRVKCLRLVSRTNESQWDFHSAGGCERLSCSLEENLTNFWHGWISCAVMSAPVWVYSYVCTWVVCVSNLLQWAVMNSRVHSGTPWPWCECNEGFRCRSSPASRPSPSPRNYNTHTHAHIFLYSPQWFDWFYIWKHHAQKVSHLHFGLKTDFVIQTECVCSVYLTRCCLCLPQRCRCWRGGTLRRRVLQGFGWWIFDHPDGIHLQQGEWVREGGVFLKTGNSQDWFLLVCLIWTLQIFTLLKQQEL